MPVATSLEICKRTEYVKYKNSIFVHVFVDQILL